MSKLSQRRLKKTALRSSPRLRTLTPRSGVGAQPFGCDEAAVGSLATVTAKGARSRHEIKGPSAVHDEVSRGELVSVRAGLGPRGDVTLWLSTDATDAWRPSPSGRPGAPKTFSDCAIETALTLRLVFRLPLRQAEGFLRSVLSLMGVDLAAPHPTTLSRRSQSLAVEFRRIPSRGPIHLIVDSTGLSIVGEGEWAAVQHGGRGHRGWKTLHLAVDRVGVIVAHALTEPTVDDATIGIDLIETVDDEIARVTADAAYETVAFYAAAEMRDATVVVPPSKTARAYGAKKRPRLGRCWSSLPSSLRLCRLRCSSSSSRSLAG